MSEPPWDHLAGLRRAAGLTQAEAAAGIVSQSMLCQIEKGRILPSADTLRALAIRFNTVPEDLVNAWQAWRMRERIREMLWDSAVDSKVSRDSANVLRSVLSEYGRLLVPFERHVYFALCAVLESNLAQAEEELGKAWATSKITLVDLNRRGSATGAPHSRATAWTKVDRARALTIEAMVHARICCATGRQLASVYWEERVGERLQHVVWPGKKNKLTPANQYRIVVK